MNKKEFFVINLLNWFKKNKRTFVWRDGTRKPFEILVAEILLQKTASNTVNKFFPKFIQKYSTPEKLAKVNLTKLKEEIKILGLYEQRAPRLKKLAKEIVKKYDGKIPDTRDDLLKLPGIGDYMANATLCFAFGKECPIIDVNVSRLIGRVFYGNYSKKMRNDKKIWEFASKLIPKGRAKEFNWALLDFGALICSPKPKCHICPLRSICTFFIKINKGG